VRFGHGWTDTLHIPIGVLRHANNTAANVLLAAGLRLGPARRALIDAADPDDAAAMTSTAARHRAPARRTRTRARPRPG
jgi:hypothetical protein